ncbi:hypothetical protein [Embleya sp. AB8]|uniref:hypothetical protein n=1 Tax=Embleya sp. AB8 TaxID=3156304 RepID=UPI003C77C471
MVTLFQQVDRRAQAVGGDAEVGEDAGAVAIEVLARAGVHGFSHRAVDEAAGVPAGTAVELLPQP